MPWLYAYNPFGADVFATAEDGVDRVIVLPFLDTGSATIA